MCEIGEDWCEDTVKMVRVSWSRSWNAWDCYVFRLLLLRQCY